MRRALSQRPSYRQTAMKKTALALVPLLVVCATGSSAIGRHETAPSDLPRVAVADVRYLGSFEVPPIDGTTWDSQQSLTFGGWGLGLGKDGKSLYYGCHDWHEKLAEISIPAIGGTASIVQRCTPVPGLSDIDENQINLGGTLLWNGRLIVSAYAFYDGDGNAKKSHAGGTPQLSGFSKFQVMSGGAAGRVGGYMGVIPAEWRELLGGPAFTGQCCLSVISRSSFGPALSVFNPDDIGRVDSAPATEVLGYTAANPLARHDSTGEHFNGTTRIGGAAFVPGSRSVVFFGFQGMGKYCYGTGEECADPDDPAKGTHAHPYRRQAWFYDAADLAKVRAGELKPYEVKPYAIAPLPGDGGRGAPGAFTTFDPATRRVYMADGLHEKPRVHVYEFAASGRPRV
jgi:hypothetical protein